MIQLSTLPLTGAIPGIRAAGFSLGTTSDFALALADLAGAPGGIALPGAPPGGLVVAAVPDFAQRPENAGDGKDLPALAVGIDVTAPTLETVDAVAGDAPIATLPRRMGAARGGRIAAPTTPTPAGIALADAPVAEAAAAPADDCANDARDRAKPAVENSPLATIPSMPVPVVPAASPAVEDTTTPAAPIDPAAGSDLATGPARARDKAAVPARANDLPTPASSPADTTDTPSPPLATSPNASTVGQAHARIGIGQLRAAGIALPERGAARGTRAGRTPPQDDAAPADPQQTASPAPIASATTDRAAPPPAPAPVAPPVARRLATIEGDRPSRASIVGARFDPAEPGHPATAARVAAMIDAAPSARGPVPPIATPSASGLVAPPSFAPTAAGDASRPVAPVGTQAVEARTVDRRPEPGHAAITIVALPVAPPPSPALQPAAQAFAAAMFAAAEPNDTRADPAADDLPLGMTAGTAPTALHTPTPAVAGIAAGQHPTLDMTRDDWMASMIDRIETLRDESGGVRETRMRLSPEALGNVEVSVRRDEAGVMQVRIAADTPQARALLADAAPKLAEMADARGLKLGGASVDSNAGSAGHHRRDTPAAPAAPALVQRRAASAADAADPITDSRLA